MVLARRRPLVASLGERVKDKAGSLKAALGSGKSVAKNSPPSTWSLVLLVL